MLQIHHEILDMTFEDMQFEHNFSIFRNVHELRYVLYTHKFVTFFQLHFFEFLFYFLSLISTFLLHIVGII